MSEERQLGFEIHSLDRLIGRQTEWITQQKLKDIPSIGGWIIGYLYRHSEQQIYQKDIEHKFCIPPSSVTKLLKQMEKQGYIERKSVENDARLKQITVTEKGAALHTDIMQDIHELLDAKLKEGLSEAEQQEFLRMLDIIRQNTYSLGAELRSQMDKEST